ncbi:MAG: ABC transporter ATP-binding protein [Anaerolineae bacterium]|jgi:ABC-2 type transport system ATP-binding protein|nr:ABC transporter ATP-binding protein [Anaerolineae bacterium]
MNAIETIGLTRRFGPLTAVDDLTLTIKQGSIFGFLGPNGAGKTTTVRMLAALIAPSQGSARVAGYALGGDSQQIRRSVGILTETPSLYERLSAWDNLILFGQLYDLSSKLAAERATHYLKLMALWDRCHEPVGAFSKGMRQRVALARALLHEPQILFLDEPTSGLDPEAAFNVRGLIQDLRAAGHTIFLTTHNLKEAEDLCDLIAIFRARLIALDTPSNLRARFGERGTLIQLRDPAATWSAIASGLPFVQRVQVDDYCLTITSSDPDQHNPALVSALAAAGAPIQYVTPLLKTLEQVYLELINV